MTRDDAAPRSSRVSCGIIMSVFVENPVDRRERRIMVSSCASYLDGDEMLFLEESAIVGLCRTGALLPSVCMSR